MSDIKTKKSELRKKILKEREQLDSQTWQSKSDLIIEKVHELEEFRKAHFIHVYVSMNERKEVSTDPLVEELLASDKNLVVPVTNFEDGTLIHSLLTDKNDLKQNKWGVKEPEIIKEIDVKKLDMIIIPMAAADRYGNRLGYGKGFYDRFLSESNAFKAGLVFSDFIFSEIPTESFDEKLDAIITENEVIYT